jgi:mannosyl-glycoprotein endo-beta-N-acetylglucosaminidase
MSLCTFVDNDHRCSIRAFFHASDGIFLNYQWTSECLLQSKNYAAERYRDVFVGIDVFGRGCFGGGGFNTCDVCTHRLPLNIHRSFSQAMAISHHLGLSTALFAPGWLFETLNINEFLDNDRR